MSGWTEWFLFKINYLKKNPNQQQQQKPTKNYTKNKKQKQKNHKPQQRASGNTGPYNQYKSKWAGQKSAVALLPCTCIDIFFYHPAAKLWVWSCRGDIWTVVKNEMGRKWFLLLNHPNRYQQVQHGISQPKFYFCSIFYFRIINAFISFLRLSSN